MELLKKYAELIKKREHLNDAILDTGAAIETLVMREGAMSGYGIKAHMKAGRKSIDHKGAAEYADVNEDIIKQFTKRPAPRTAWAKVTKAARVTSQILREHTTQNDPTFVIEAVK